MTNQTEIPALNESDTAFVGLAPFLRMSIAGVDFLPYGQEMLLKAQDNPDDAALWMNLATVMMCLGQRELGLQIQAQALSMQRVYHLAAWQQPARLRVLLLLAADDLAANTPLDCLLENCDVDIDFYYVSPGDPLASPIPEHDILIVGISASDSSRATLAALEDALRDWPRPVVNAPQNVPHTERDTASKLLQDAPGLFIPPTLRASRAVLQAVASGASRLPDHFADTDFPVILRPVGSQAGRDLDRMTRPEDVASYLAGVDGDDFFLSRFIDYSGKDGMFRKIRIALVDGEPFVCHMAVSTHWIVHYVNADMYERAERRAEEAAFMADFDDFARRHRAALDAIYQRTRLDYLCIDCAEMQDGRLLIFEIDHAMVVHDMDSDAMFPYKHAHMQKVRNAFLDLLNRRIA